MTNMPECTFLDSHLHLQDPRFQTDREAVLLRAKQAGVGRMFCNATQENDWQDVLNIASTSDAIVPFVGIHPWFCDTTSNGWQGRLAGILETTDCGIGETGIDKKCSCNLRRQEETFISQLQLAVYFQRPLTIHCLGSWGKMLDILGGLAKTGALPPLLLHSFGGSLEVMQRLVQLGCTISFSARLAASGQERLRRVFQETPLSRILLETDAPGQLQAEISCTNKQASRYNEPAHITALYVYAANLYNMDLQDFCRQIWQNGKIFTDSAIPR